MNRRDRRAHSARKLSRHATAEEIMPGSHGPISSNLADVMKAAIEALRDGIGREFEYTLFIAERASPQGEDRAPRFNYISTAARPDMIAVLKAFIGKMESAGPDLDKINDAPPTGTAQ